MDLKFNEKDKKKKRNLWEGENNSPTLALKHTQTRYCILFQMKEETVDANLMQHFFYKTGTWKIMNVSCAVNLAFLW